METTLETTAKSREKKGRPEARREDRIFRFTADSEKEFKRAGMALLVDMDHHFGAMVKLKEEADGRTALDVTWETDLTIEEVRAVLARQGLGLAEDPPLGQRAAPKKRPRRKMKAAAKW